VPLGADELLREMNAAGVSRAVLVPPYWDAERDDVVLAAVRAHPDRFAAMGRPDTETPVPPVPIATWCGQPGVLGLRCSFIRPRQIATLMEGRMDWLWRDAERAGVPVMILTAHSLMHVIDRIAGRHPALRLAMCHLGLTSHEYDEVAFRDLDQLLALAKRPNVSVNASALPVYTRDRYPYHRLHPYLRRVYDAFGPRRMFWGTDYSRLPCSYHEAVTMFTEEIPWLSIEDKEWIMGRGLCEWLRWPSS
jgi:predicted TIM-barrel fold metal-dependent hydrolase